MKLFDKIFEFFGIEPNDFSTQNFTFMFTSCMEEHSLLVQYHSTYVRINVADVNKIISIADDSNDLDVVEVKDDVLSNVEFVIQKSEPNVYVLKVVENDSSLISETVKQEEMEKLKKFLEQGM